MRPDFGADLAEEAETEEAEEGLARAYARGADDDVPVWASDVIPPEWYRNLGPDVEAAAEPERATRDVVGEAVDPVRAALYLVGQQGFAALPVWGSKDGRCFCGDPHDGTRREGLAPDSIGKHPASPRGFHDATRDPDRIRTFLANPGTPNYGLVPPPGVIALDIDGSGIARWRELEAVHRQLPPTLTTITRNGHHYFYRWPESVGPDPGGDLFGFVTRRHGKGYVIGPGSVHASGTTYAVVRQPDGQPYPIVELPEAWAKAASKGRPAGERGSTVRVGGYTLPDRVAAGAKRYYEIRDYVAHLHHYRRTPEEMWVLVRDLLAPRFEEPLDEGALRARFERAIKDMDARLPGQADPRPEGPWPEPEDVGHAQPSELADVEYVEDLIRPGRKHVWAAEEGSGKSYAVDELGVRIALAGGAFAGSWPVKVNGPVLVLSEMHRDDDLRYQDDILGSLGLDRSALSGRLYRQDLATAAHGMPALTVPGWRAWITKWMRERGVILLVVDTATSATQVDPWGKAIHEVYAGISEMLHELPGLAVVLVLHLKKPQGRGERRISDVLGEWGRFNDITILMEADGATRTKLSTYKRIRHPRRIIATKQGGLLVDPVDITEKVATTKVPLEKVVDAVRATPGASTTAMAEALGVSKSTATKYLAAAAAAGLVISLDAGPGRGKRHYPAAEPAPDPAMEASRGPTPSSVRTGGSLDGGEGGSDGGPSNRPTHPMGLDGPLDTPPPWDATDGNGAADEAILSDAVPESDGAFCPACRAGPFTFAPFYERHWRATHARHAAGPDRPAMEGPDVADTSLWAEARRVFADLLDEDEGHGSGASA